MRGRPTATAPRGWQVAPIHRGRAGSDDRPRDRAEQDGGEQVTAAALATRPGRCVCIEQSVFISAPPGIIAAVARHRRARTAASSADHRGLPGDVDIRVPVRGGAQGPRHVRAEPGSASASASSPHCRIQRRTSRVPGTVTRHVIEGVRMSVDALRRMPHGLPSRAARPPARP